MPSLCSVIECMHFCVIGVDLRDYRIPEEECYLSLRFHQLVCLG